MGELRDDDGGSSSAAVVIGAVAAGIVLLGTVLLLALWRRRTTHSGGKDAGKIAELYALLLQRVQSEFLLGYKQLIGGAVASFDDYKQLIAGITVAPSAIKLGAELGRGNYGSVYAATLRRSRTDVVAVAVKVPAADRVGQEWSAASVEKSAALLLEAFVQHGTPCVWLCVAILKLSRGCSLAFILQCMHALDFFVDNSAFVFGSIHTESCSICLALYAVCFMFVLTLFQKRSRTHVLRTRTPAHRQVALRHCCCPVCVW